MLAVALVVMFTGCINTPVKETSNSTMDNITSNSTMESQSKDRYVQINFLDGSYAGGKYVSETPGFTTIAVMYVYDPHVTAGTFFSKGNGKEVAFKNSLINSIVPIDDPTLMIESKLAELNSTNPH